ncbi:MAG: phytanoyl-CoA dioxygenase family protein [Gammaproteobacteria bacterium]|nr:phytanoyl-CoA dioxygenase family protein [Gammaproteobacteria bacterium]
MPTAGHPTRLSEAARELGLEPYILDLEVNGLTIVPPEVHGVAEDRFDLMLDLVLKRAEELVGCPFSLDRGPHAELDFSPNPGSLIGYTGDENVPTQFLLQTLGRVHRVFRDVAVNPVAVAFMRHMIGGNNARFSSHNSFVKWHGGRGYGPTLGLHADQGRSPLPWGRNALNGNTNWCLTDYTREGGALAYVPGSHRRVTRPVQAQDEAVPAECPKGSLIVWHGATWHGAFPRMIPGMRVSVTNYYRHRMVTSQEDIRATFPRELAEDCDDPALFRLLAGFEDRGPYVEQSYPIPRARRSDG